MRSIQAGGASVRLSQGSRGDRVGHAAAGIWSRYYLPEGHIEKGNTAAADDARGKCMTGIQARWSFAATIIQFTGTNNAAIRNWYAANVTAARWQPSSIS